MGNTSHLREQSGFAAHSTRTAAVSLASNNQKRTFNLAALVALALAALLAVFGTAAFTVGAAPADNVITFGSVKMRVCEFTLNDSGSEVPFEASASGDYPATKVSSGAISRIVRVQNAGSEPMYVRVRLAMRSVSPDGKTADAGNVVRLNLNDSADAPWVDGGDGWYYYRGTAANGGVVNAGEYTENLLNSVSFVGDYQATAQGGSFQLVVDAQAVQAKNQQEDGTPLDVLDVAGWPEAR